MGKPSQRALSIPLDRMNVSWTSQRSPISLADNPADEVAGGMPDGAEKRHLQPAITSFQTDSKPGGSDRSTEPLPALRPARCPD